MGGGVELLTAIVHTIGCVEGGGNSLDSAMVAYLLTYHVLGTGGCQVVGIDLHCYIDSSINSVGISW
jgi:hypothetical protein